MPSAGSHRTADIVDSDGRRAQRATPDLFLGAAFVAAESGSGSNCTSAQVLMKLNEEARKPGRKKSDTGIQQSRR
jgi:hypothetical protein